MTTLATRMAAERANNRRIAQVGRELRASLRDCLGCGEPVSEALSVDGVCLDCMERFEEPDCCSEHRSGCGRRHATAAPDARRAA